MHQMTQSSQADHSLLLKSFLSQFSEKQKGQWCKEKVKITPHGTVPIACVHWKHFLVHVLSNRYVRIISVFFHVFCLLGCQGRHSFHITVFCLEDWGFLVNEWVIISVLCLKLVATVLSWLAHTIFTLGWSRQQVMVAGDEQAKTEQALKPSANKVMMWL